MPETTTFFSVYEGMSIPEIIVDALTKMTSGVTGSLRQSFDSLVLNEAGTGLSALAIWVLSFMGVGFIWKIVPQAKRLFRRGR